MSRDIPEVVDAGRMVASRRRFEGRIGLGELPRLSGLLDRAEGEAVFSLEFDQDPTLRVPFVEVEVDAELPLQCQRTLERFLLPVRLKQRHGLLRDEADEAGLPLGYEALLVDESGDLRLLELVEDELILAVPLIPVKPGSESVASEWPATEEEIAQASPFAALAALKNH